MLNIKETVMKEVNANMYSYIEVYDVDTEVLIYQGWAWDCPYMDEIVCDYAVYNFNNNVNFVLWIDF